MPPVMTHDQYSNDITNNAKQKMIRKALKIDSPKITLSNRKRFRTRRCFRYQMPQFGIEFVCEL